MEEKELEASDADLKAAVTDKHESSNPADMDPIDYLALLMEQEHR